MKGVLGFLVRSALNPNLALGQVADYCPDCDAIQAMLVRKRSRLPMRSIAPRIERSRLLHSVECLECHGMFDTDVSRYTGLASLGDSEFGNIVATTNLSAHDVLSCGTRPGPEISASWPTDATGPLRSLVVGTLVDHGRIARKLRPRWLKFALALPIVFAVAGIVAASACILAGHLTPCFVTVGVGLGLAFLLSLFAVLEHETLGPRRAYRHLIEQLDSMESPTEHLEQLGVWAYEFDLTNADWLLD